MSVDPGELFETRPLGTTLWLAARGTSLAPFLRGDDALEARRCGPEELSRGEIALLRREDGALIAHWVVDVRPVRTSSTSGVVDRGPVRVLGKVVAVRRLGRVIHLRQAWAPALWAVHALWAQFVRKPSLRGLANSVVHLSGPVRRRLLGEVELRELGPEALELLRRFAPASLGTTDEELGRLLGPPNATIGAFRSNKLAGLGVCVLEPEGPTVRYLWISLAARATGLEREILARLVERHKARRALAHSGQDTFVAALKQLGFHEAGEGEPRLFVQ